MDPKFLSQACEAFDFACDVVSYKRCNSGHINDTFFLDCGEGNPKYILSKVNTSIFSNPDELMSNLLGVCNHVSEKIKQNGGNVKREVRNIIPAKNGGYYYIDSEGNYWRAFLEVENVVAHDVASSTRILYNSAVAFGKFFKQLSDYPVDTLYETIPDFHNTVKRMEALELAVEKNFAGRAEEVKDEIDFALSKKSLCSFISDGLEDGRFKTCVTHNDTKLNNVLMDADTDEGVCIIDLDTVMPGSVLYDFGDGIRFGASSAAEDETDLDKVYLDLEKFEAFTSGFLSELKSEMTEDEMLSLPMGAYLMTLEVGIRFLADYLNGDIYYHTEYPQHNRDRARNQLKLVSDMDSKMDQMLDIVKKYM